MRNVQIVARPWTVSIAQSVIFHKISDKKKSLSSLRHSSIRLYRIVAHFIAVPWSIKSYCLTTPGNRYRIQDDKSWPQKPRPLSSRSRR